MEFRRYLFYFAILTSNLGNARAELCEDLICEYEFLVHWRQTMNYYYNSGNYALPVVLNGTDLVIAGSTYRPDEPEIGTMTSPDDVITGDGRVRDIIVINGMLPGPTIEVMEGSQVVVHVTNALVNQEFTLHWHGMHQRDTPFMDGAFHITQCGIAPGQTFTYRFTADPAGTHWYHSHLGSQMIDGGVGMIIVREKPPTVREHEVFVSDWYKFGASEFEHLNPFTDTPVRGSGHDLITPVTLTDHSRCYLSSTYFHSGVINFKGRHGPYPGVELYPLSRFEVTQGETHRFRMVNSAAETTFEVSVDGHQLTVVAADGHEIQPEAVDYIILGMGETIDFTLLADQTSGSYWFRAETLQSGTYAEPESIDVRDETRAIVVYSGAPPGDPSSSKRQCTSGAECVVYGCPWAIYKTTDYRRCVNLDDVTSSASSAATLEEDYGLDDGNVKEMFVNVATFRGHWISRKRFQHPQVPLLGKELSEIPDKCSDFPSCPDPDSLDICTCTDIEDIPQGQTVQLVMTNIRNPGDQTCRHHPMHLHGYSFAVVAAGYGKYDPNSGYIRDVNTDIACDDDYCTHPSWNGSRPALNLVNPPIRDTFLLPASGYVVLRFKATNPGYWLLHCHQVLHHLLGMAMVLNVGPGQHPPLPPGFQTCENFNFTGEQYKDYKEGKWTPKESGILLSEGALAGIIIGTFAFGLIIAGIAKWLCSKLRSKNNEAAISELKL